MPSLGSWAAVLGSAGNAAMSALTQYQMMEYMKEKPKDKNVKVMPRSQELAGKVAKIKEVTTPTSQEEEVMVEEPMEKSNQPLWLRDIWRGGYGSTDNR